MMYIIFKWLLIQKRMHAHFKLILLITIRQSVFNGHVKTITMHAKSYIRQSISHSLDFLSIPFTLLSTGFYQLI